MSGPEPDTAADRDQARLSTLAAALVRQTTTFVALCDAQLELMFLNASGREIVGLPDDADVEGHAFCDFVAPSHRPVVQALGIPALLREGRWEGELSFRHLADPSRETAVRCSIFALRDETGEAMGAIAIMAHRSGALDAERALRGQQMLFASLLDHLPVGVGIYDRDGRLVHSNPRLSDYAGLSRLPSRQATETSRWRGYGGDQELIRPSEYPGARALRGETAVPGIDFKYSEEYGPERWLRVSAVPFRPEGEKADQAIVVVQDVDDLKKATERIEAARAELASQSRFLNVTLSSIPDFVYAFDRQRRFVYANPVMLGLFGLTADEMLGKTLDDLDYPPDLAKQLNDYIDQVLIDGVTVEDEVFFRSPTGHAAYFAFLWGPVHAKDGSVELVVGVSRDTSERRAIEEELRKSEARLRAATDLVGVGIYAWDPITGALDWDERLRAMWGLPSDAVVDMDVYETGIHPDDLPRVRAAIAACVDPAGDGRYDIEYRVQGRDDGVMRHIATSGRTTFVKGRAVDFIGAAIDVTAQRRAEAAIRASEAQFRSFTAHSRNLIWIIDRAAGKIIYRSAAYERIWGQPCDQGPDAVSEWMKDVHPDDRRQVEHAFATVEAGEVAQFEYRIIRPTDGAIRWLRDTSFPIPDDTGAVTRIGGITEDLTQEDVRQVYIVSAKPAEARRLAGLVRALGYRARIFERGSAFLDMALVLAPGCVLVDLRKFRDEGLSIPRELKARSMGLPVIAMDAPGAGVGVAVDAMKAGAVDYLVDRDEGSLRIALASAMAECHGAIRPALRDDNATARLSRLTPREREVLAGLIEGGTNKSIAQKLGISPRTVELHRAQVMNRLDATNLTELLQLALAAGLTPKGKEGHNTSKAT